MGMFDWIFKRTPGTLAGSSLFGWFGNTTTHAGIDITPETAMSSTAVYACVNVISDAIAGIPAQIIKADGSGLIAAHPISTLLNRTPNEEMSSADFRSALMVNLLLWGASYAWIQRDGLNGRPVALWPLRSSATRLDRDPTSGGLIYHTTVNGQSFQLGSGDVFHLRGWSLDGLLGISPIVMARDAIGLALATEKFAGKFFSNGGNVSGLIELPAAMKPAAVKAFIESWKTEHNGSDNALKVAVLTDGMKYTRTGIEPEKAQMVDTRVHQVREIARIYRVPLHMIGDLERATFSNIEHQAIEFVQNTLSPYLTKWEQEAARKLFTVDEQASLEIRFNLDSLLRADTTSRYAAYNAARQGGWLSVNDIRSKESLPPVEGSDELLKPLNMTPVVAAK